VTKADLQLDLTAPGLSLALHRLRTVAEAARFVGAALPNVGADIKWARIRLAENVPALAGDRLLDWQTLDKIVHALIGMYEEGPNDSASSAVRRDVDFLADALGEDALTDATCAGAWDALAQLPTPNGADARQTAITLLDYASRPALHAAARDLRDVIAQSGWTRGTCPACGALPLLAELHSNKEESSRVLRCGRCGTAWSIGRLACPACGERDHAKLRYVHVDGEMDHRRAECCISCGFYVKAAAVLHPLDEKALFDMDLTTLGLDTLGIEAGYHR
jgi:formate dehydrogenase accessory protein FdhE